jgi:ACS family tartrate transporter-like MFS transporter
MPPSEIEQRTLRKVSWRVLPLVLAAYFLANLDRSNISYAALQMNHDLHLTAEQFGLAAGLFSLTYLLLEIPSNLALERFGARLWIARIMISWGILSAATAFVVGPNSFVALRLLLGAAEAGLVPGVLLYITYWFPDVLRGRAVAIFLVAAPVSNIVSALLSVPLLGMNGFLGLGGWQWLLIIEALPAVILGVITALVMTNKPSDAKWLSKDERSWLQRRLDSEKAAPTALKPSLWQTIRKPRVMALAIIYALRNVGAFGITFFLPQIVRDLGLSNTEIGGVNSVSYLVAVVGMVLWARSSDRTGERRWHLTASMLVAAAGLAYAAWLGSSQWSLVALAIAAIGYYACPPCIFAISPSVLAPVEAAAGIAFINCFAQIGSIVGPYGAGWIRSETGSFQGAMYFMAACSVLAAVIAALIKAPNTAPASRAGVRGDPQVPVEQGA